MNATNDVTETAGNDGWRSRWRLTYTAGEWLALAGPSAAVLLQPASPQWSELIGTIWEDVLAAEGIEDLLERMAAFRLEGMPSFAALFWGPDGVRSLARGSVQLLDDETGRVLLDGTGVQTWSETSLAGSRRVRISTRPGRPAGEVLALPLLIGAVGVAELIVETGADRQVGTRQGVTASAGFDGSDSLTDDLAGLPVSEPVPVRSSADRAGEAPGPEPATEAFAVPATPEHAGAEPAGPGLADAAPSGVGGDRWDESRDGHTLIAPSLPGSPGAGLPPTAATAPFGVPGAVSDDDEDDESVRGHTVLAPNLPGGPMLPPAAPPRRVVAVLRPSSGGQVEVDRPVLIGRAPSANRVSGGQLPRLLTVPSPSHDISRTHLQVAPGDDQVLVTDMNSTNGTLVVTADGRRLTLEPSTPAPLEPGAVIDLGDGITIAVDPPATEPLGGADR